MCSKFAEIRVSPRRRDAPVHGRPFAAAVPAEAESVAVGRLGTHARVKALIDDPVLRLEEELFDQHGLAEPRHPPTHLAGEASQANG